MQDFERREIDVAIRAHIQQGKPYLGICLGFQVLFESGTEGSRGTAGSKAAGTAAARGIAAFEGEVDRLEPGLPIPHVGWNRVEIVRKHPIFDGIETGAQMYFIHSYHPKGVNEADVLAYAQYGETFTCAAAHGSAAGTQFHPEKSGAHGLRLLRNFTSWRP